jgi:hypothetical protein
MAARPASIISNALLESDLKGFLKPSRILLNEAQQVPELFPLQHHVIDG